ncbi:hypothetical protein LWF15_13935 [Kineosporia rhizophila]|uniref:hypothetical protein n=1 Tax=Kineosporia rhizophila TaxID=84633 RepID=UPI000B043219|nr:hypothetical protein [Kineosporia rhizophila]MCE0536608.1 hypothetical protein [Kineosporia rhizophila]
MKIPSWLRNLMAPPAERDAERAAAADAATVQWAVRVLPDMHPIEQASLLTNLDQGGVSVPGYEAPDMDDYRYWAWWCAGGILNAASYERFWAETLTDPDDQRVWDPEPAWPPHYGGMGKPQEQALKREQWKAGVAERQARDEQAASQQSLLEDPPDAALLDELVEHDHEAPFVDDRLVSEGLPVQGSGVHPGWQDGLDVQEEANDHGISPIEYMTPDPAFPRSDLDVLGGPEAAAMEEEL